VSASIFVPVNDCGAKLSGTVRDVPGPERIVDLVKAGRSNMLPSFFSPSIVEADAARAFLSSKRSALSERLSLSSLSVYISKCRRGCAGTSRFSTNCHQAIWSSLATEELA